MTQPASTPPLGSTAPPWAHDRYEARGLLGSGSFGDVHLARDLVRGHEVAIKVLRRWDDVALTQLRKEFRALRDIQHPHLVELYELHATSGDGFITMEVVRGPTILEFVQAAGSAAERRSRARRCLTQLVDAVATLHAHGTLHRDLKPSNIIVTEGERLVLLDAGLAQSIDGQRSSERYICGTPIYMSPEQAYGGALQPASDWYSVGVVAHELFTGAVPFEAHPRGVLAAKLIAPAPPIRQVCPDLVGEDAAIIDRLLAQEAADRPDAHALLRWLGLPPMVASATDRSARGCVGREAELAALHDALHAARAHGTAILSVTGDSGIGKTTLVQHWLDQLPDSEVLRFTGRCYQRETVPFGGFDDILEIVRRTIQAHHRPAWLGANEVAATQLVIRGAADAPAPQPAEEPREAVPPEPLERRRLFGSAVSKTLAHLARGRTLLVWLDDLQWGDLETATLLADVARTQHPEGCLLVLGHRPAAADDGGCLAHLRRYVETSRELEVGPLPPSDAKLLVQRMAGAQGFEGLEAERLVSEAAGHPLLLQEATRYRAKTGRAESTSLDEILGERVAQLPADAQAVLRVLSVAAEPLADSVAVEAAGLPRESAAARVLLANDLVRRVGHSGHRLVPFHDQLRLAVTGALDEPAARAINASLAAALVSRPGTQPEVLVKYFLAASDQGSAARHIVSAASHMLRALAFDRAVGLFRLCLELQGDLDPSERFSARLGLADALVNSGRVEEGARLRLELAAARAGAEAEHLVSQASTELIRAGCVDEGLSHARTTLARLGVRLSGSPLRSVPSLALGRARIALRGLRYEIKAPAAVPTRLLERIDWCQSLAIVLPVIDTLRGLQVHNQGLIAALEAGEPARLAQALAMEAGFRMALAGGHDREGKAAELLGSARVLADASGNARARGIVEIIVGSTRWSAGDWRGCLEHTEIGVDLLRRNCAGVFWEVNFGHTHLLDALGWLGDLRKKRLIVFHELDQARTRGDRYAETMYTLRDMPTILLLDDRPVEARACSRALASWPNRGFQIEHMVDLYKQTEVDLYEGRGMSAMDRVDRKWGALSRAQHMKFQPFRIEMKSLYARAALAAAAELGSGRERERLLDLAEKLSTAIEAETPSVRGAVFGAPVAAGVAWQRGNRQGARRILERGAAQAGSHGMRVHESAMRAQAGEAGHQAAIEWLREQGARAPERYARMLCPGIAG